MTPFTDWLPHVQLKNCPRILAIDAIRSAAQEFCKETLAWQYTQDPITVYIGEGEYPYEPPSCADVVQPLQAWFDGAPIEVKTQADLDRLYRGSNWLTVTGSPLYIVHLTPRNANLVPIPEEKTVNGLQIRVALKPTNSATEIDDLIFEDHRDAIAFGAKARLKLMSEQPFFDAKGATVDGAIFRDRIATEKIRVQRGHGPTNMTARNPFGKFA